VGVGESLFEPNRLVSNQEFTTFLLRALGYSEDAGDFTFARALNKALDIEMYCEDVLDELESGRFLRADAVVAMVKALQTPIKGSADVLLIDTLVTAGAVTSAQSNLFLTNIARIDGLND